MTVAGPRPSPLGSDRLSFANNKRLYDEQSEKLGHTSPSDCSKDKDPHRAVQAKFVTAQDPVIETADGQRLPTVPLEEALHLNRLKDKIEGRKPQKGLPVKSGLREAKDGTIHGATAEDVRTSEQSSRPDAPLRNAAPPARTNPLFPPMPLYGPPNLMRSMQCHFFRATSWVLSLLFLLVVVLGAAFCSIPAVSHSLFLRATFRDPHSVRPFYHEEQKRQKKREKEDQEWEKNNNVRGNRSPATREREITSEKPDDFIPTEGGEDPLICDVAYYARREGLDAETFQVQTEDGFIIELQHIYNPLTSKSSSPKTRQPHSPSVFNSDRTDSPFPTSRSSSTLPSKRYPILLLHGLLQSSGAYCCTGPDSLAFYLAKAGYDVWLGNNRCGFVPRHTLLKYADPRMWSWNIRQMGVLDLSALVSRVLSETSSARLALVAHSQGTTQTLVALAKEQRPELGRKISVFCALAPAAYAGPLIGKAYFKFMRVITPGMFRCIFGIHSFIPFMLSMHKVLPGKFYGDMGYLVFSFLFNWSDARWDKGLRARCFQFSPTYVSAESMRWWLGRECFATQKCILATREEGKLEDEEDEEEDEVIKRYYEGGRNTSTEDVMRQWDEKNQELERELNSKLDREERGRYSWYDDNFPPLAMWVCGNDDLVDGRRLLRRFDRGREPHVNVVHKKIIEGYEHLDVIWAMDSIEKVGSEIKDVVWKTMSDEDRKLCNVPHGCEELTPFDLKRPEADTNDGEEEQEEEKASSIHKGKGKAPDDTQSGRSAGPVSPTMIDTTKGEWTDGLKDHDASNDSRH